MVVLGITCGVSLKIRATKKKNQKIWSERKVDIGVFLPGDDDSQSLTEDKSADSLSLQIAAALGMIGGVTTVSSGLLKMPNPTPLRGRNRGRSTLPHSPKRLRVLSLGSVWQRFPNCQGEIDGRAKDGRLERSKRQQHSAHHYN